MADLGQEFVADEVDDKLDFAAIPAGKYLALISGSEVKVNKKQNGTIAVFKFQIIDGPHKNRIVYLNINLTNPNQDAVNIGKGDLKQIAKATGKPRFSNTEVVHNIPLVIELKVVEYKGEKKNEVKNVLPTAVPVIPPAVIEPPIEPQAARQDVPPPQQTALGATIAPAMEPAGQPAGKPNWMP